MEILDRQGDYQIAQEGFWAVLLDAEGNVLIPAEKHYRTISHVENGVAIGYVDGKYGLIDLQGNHIGEFKYGYIEPCGEGYYRVEMGTRKNVLRRDGTEVLKVWFNDVYNVEKGFFIIGNTIRKTSEHPTLYPRGLAYVNGDILFPPMFNRLRRLDEKKTMPLDDVQKIIDAEHASIQENTGLVEARIGKTQYDKRYAYSIVRVLLKPHGVAYVLNLHLYKDHQAVSITGRFTERGVTGRRETTALEFCIRKGWVKKETYEGWVEDPYDKEFKKGSPSNLSELPYFDGSFRTHPLSELRGLIQDLLLYN